MNQSRKRWSEIYGRFFRRNEFLLFISHESVLNNCRKWYIHELSYMRFEEYILTPCVSVHVYLHVSLYPALTYTYFSQQYPFMLFWPRISVHPCNENQLDALFIFSLFRQSTSTNFGHICSPSSGGTIYIHNTYQLLYIYSIPPDDGQQICPKHVQVDWRNKLRTNSVSSWFHYTKIYSYFHFSLTNSIPIPAATGSNARVCDLSIVEWRVQIPPLHGYLSLPSILCC